MSEILKGLTLQKAGNTLEENEDAFFPKKINWKQKKIYRFGIADGATMGVFSGKWAKILVRKFCSWRNLDFSCDLFLRKAYKDWTNWLEKYKENRNKSKIPIQWFEESGFEAGAFSTFLGLEINNLKGTKKGTWKAFAVGDSCLFHVRGNKLETSFPILNSEEFSNSPFLISAKSEKHRQNVKNFYNKEGEWRKNDFFFLATDALSKWIFQEKERNGNPWLELKKAIENKKQNNFIKMVNRERESLHMKNDDTTCLVIRI